LTGAGRLIPTGTCWCGCGADTKLGSFFLSGHDKVAESAVVNVEYGGVVQFLDRHGYGPGGKNPRQTLDRWRASGGRVR
jgi:hypothetical protein